MNGVLADWPHNALKDQQGWACDVAALFNAVALKVREGRRDVVPFTHLRTHGEHRWHKKMVVIVHHG